ncbi:hypothetical protein LQW54_002746 [Pestalotiopsis sp. IQ-011]
MGAPSALQVTTVMSFVILASCRALALDRAGVTGSQPGDASPSTLGASSCDYSAEVKKQLLPLWIVLGIVGAGVLIWLMCWYCRQAILAYFRIKHNKRMNESVRTTHWGCANNACVACLVEARQAEEGNVQLERLGEMNTASNEGTSISVPNKFHTRD